MKTSVETAASGSLEPKRAASTVPTHRNVERLLTGPIGAMLWRLAAPNTIGFLVGSGVTVAEMWFVGQLGIHSPAGLALGLLGFVAAGMVVYGLGTALSVMRGAWRGKHASLTGVAVRPRKTSMGTAPVAVARGANPWSRATSFKPGATLTRVMRTHLNSHRKKGPEP